MRRISLQPLWEWRFEVPHGSAITVRLKAGTAERDGTELAVNVAYRFSGTKSKLLTWRGCDIEFEGECDEYVAEHASPDETPMVSYHNLHFLLDGQRKAVRSSHGQGQGPRVMVCGPNGSGKTSLVRTLTALAVRTGEQAVAVNTDPREGMLGLPGTLTAAVFATVMDIEGESGGWGGTPSSGPNAVPVKLPLVHYYGKEGAEDDMPLYKDLVSRLAGAVTARMAGDAEVRSSGLLIDTPGVNMSGKHGIEALAHIVDEFSVNIIVVLGSARMNAELLRRFSTEKTSLGEPINVVLLDKSEGVVERDEAFMQQAHEAAIKEYFFGDTKRTLSPFTQQVDFDGVTIYRAADREFTDWSPRVSCWLLTNTCTANEYVAGDKRLEKVEPIPGMAHWTLAVMNASISDSPEAIQSATVMGFVYVADVDKERRKLKILAPVSGRLNNWPLLWGKWPEPYINLLG